MVQKNNELLDRNEIETIVDQAIEILETKGVLIESEECQNLFNDKGITPEAGWVKIPRDLIHKSIKSSPKSIVMYDRDELTKFEIDSYSSIYAPGSTALNILDPTSGSIRNPNTEDYIEYAQTVDQLKNLQMQSTAFVPNDVPIEISDFYRLYLSLIYCKKPIITGTFRKSSHDIMTKMLIEVRGDQDSLKNKPLAVFDASITTPLTWSDLTSQSIIDSARHSIPSEIISMPILGVNTPASMISALVIHTAEIMSGVVISQLAKPGSPIIWGGSASVFDMKHGTTPIGAIESMMITQAYSQIGKHFNLPTHGYTGLSDSKSLDYQSGFETGFALALNGGIGVNIVAGAGMIDFQSSFSIEKMIIDNEIIGMINRFREGIQEYKEVDTVNIMKSHDMGEQFLTHSSTRNIFRDEFYFPSNTILRGLENEKHTSIINRATKSRFNLLDTYSSELEENKKAKLFEIIENTGYSVPNLV